MTRKLQTKHLLESYSDEDLLLQIHTEDDNRYAGELFKRYAPLVFGVCYKYLKDKVKCKDLVMDVFEAFLKKPPAHDISSFKSWLLAVTKNTCLSHLRDNSRKNSQEAKFKIFEKSAEIFMENEDVWSLNSRASSEPQLDAFLKSLKEPQQVCIRLFYLEGKSYKEIEERTDYDLNQIKSYLQNGKRKLKLLLERKGTID